MTTKTVAEATGIDVVDARELTSTFHYNMKINLGNYQSAECGLFVQFVGDPVGNPEQFEANARKAAVTAKGVIFQQLGQQYTIDSDGVMQAVLAEAFPTAAPARTNSPRIPAPAAGNDNSGGVAIAGGGQFIGSTADGGEVVLRNSKFGPYYTVEGTDIKASVAKFDLNPDGTVKPEALSVAAFERQLAYKNRAK